MIERRLPDPGRALLRALLTELPGLEIDRSWDTPWASITFSGTRHEIGGRLEGTDASGRARDFAARAGTIEFALPGHIVADIVVRAHPAGEAVRIEIEALTIEDR